MLVVLSACSVHIEFPRWGVVTDEETGKPIPDAIVSANLRYTCYLPPNPGGPNSSDLSEVIATTDANGEYSSPLRLFVKPPLWCPVDKTISFYKPGYFPWRYRFTPLSQDVTEKMVVGLEPMTHLLHFRPDGEAKLRQDIRSSFLSEARRRYLAAHLTIDLLPTDVPGTFIRLPGSQIDRVQAIRHSAPSVPHLLAHDAAADRWIVFDDRGKLSARQDLAPQSPGLSGSNRYRGEKLFERLTAEAMEDGGVARFKKGEVSAIEGNERRFVTFEDGGRYLCTYDNSKGPEPQVIAAADLIGSQEDETARFVYMQMGEHDLFVIVRAQDGWHVWERSQGDFSRLAHFLFPAEITAVYFQQNQCFLAFSGEGVRLFSIRPSFHEQPSPLSSLAKELGADITSISGDFSSSPQVVYMAFGGDRVLRFARDGRPDYPVRIAGETLKDWYSKPIELDVRRSHPERQVRVEGSPGVLHFIQEQNEGESYPDPSSPEER